MKQIKLNLRNGERMKYKMRDYFIYEIIIFLIYMLLISIIFTHSDREDKDYIQNIETKQNIYEQSYNNFVNEI